MEFEILFTSQPTRTRSLTQRDGDDI